MIGNYGEYRKMESKEICDMLTEVHPEMWWDHVTALRSDDFDSGSTKQTFTCFLRGANGYALDIRDFERYILMHARIGQTFYISSHWSLHTIQALENLLGILRGDVQVICDILIQWLDNEEIDSDLIRVKEIIRKYAPTQNLD